jgi:sporulation-control protein spo0M
MKTVEEIRKSDSGNKIGEYINLATSLKESAKEIADVTSNVFAEKIYEEIEMYCKKVVNADCEFTAYVNCHAVELWFSKIEEQF